MSMSDYPYRESHRASRPITPSPLRALLLLVPLLLLLIPAGLLVWHYWPVGGAMLNPSAQLRDVDTRGPLLQERDGPDRSLREGPAVGGSY